AEELPGSPTDIQLEPTVRCNLHCITCSRDTVIGSYKKTDLELTEVDQILSLFPNLRSVKLQGLGEPMLHPQIARILQKFQERNIRIWTISNGTLFNTEKYRRLILDYVSDIAVSFDSVNKEVFGFLRGTDMDKVIQGARQLIAERDDAQKQVLIGLNTTVSHKNFTELDRFYDLARDLKIDYLSLNEVENWMIQTDLGFKESAAFVAESRKHAAEIKKAVSRLRFKLLRSGILSSYSNSGKRLGNCFWPFKSLFISVEGAVTPCCLRVNREHALVKDLFNAGSVEEVWGSEAYRNLRKAHLCGDQSHPLCGQCPD
ncbi:MAG: radical SAM protein, partial [Verrucomicrobia bacterium]|nr:radical SAM protein [Verrucomicrobiota bacterium]